MNFSTRSLGPAVLLLLVFLGATTTLQWWSAKETQKLQTAAIEEQRARFTQAVIVSGLSPEKWAISSQLEMNALLGGTVELLPPGTAIDQLATTKAASGGSFTFVEPLPNAPGWHARVKFAPSALIRAQTLHQRTLTVVVFLALIVAATPLILALLSSRGSSRSENTSHSPWNMVRAQAVGMEQLAKISHERTTALAREHGARMRAEENLEVNRGLLDHSLAERARLGRELHDNICQTLYAVCLTLESVQKKNTLAPVLQKRVEQCMGELRRLNQEVRSYLQELEPAKLNEQTFVGAVGNMLAAFSTDGTVQIDQQLDEASTALIPSYQTAAILNVLREAVSNAIRHGHARHITMRSGRSECEIALSVQDDGIGFAPNLLKHDQPGHGLTNMKLRAAEMGGSLKVESADGKGTRIILTLPVASSL